LFRRQGRGAKATARKNRPESHLPSSFKMPASSKLTAKPITRSGLPHAVISTGARVYLTLSPAVNKTFMKLVRYRQGTPLLPNAAHGPTTNDALIGLPVGSARTTVSPPEINTLSQDEANTKAPGALDRNSLSGPSTRVCALF